MEKIPMTAAGHAALESELRRRTAEERPRIIELISEARGHGDLSENAEYQEAREMQAAVEERIQKLEHILKYAKIVRSAKSDAVGMGTTVSVQRIAAKGAPAAGEDKHTYTIVGAEEANIIEGKVSYHSPLGSALMGKKKGDEFSFHTPKGAQRYKILKIE